MTIKEARESRGLSRAELSRRLEIPVRTLENWDAGVNSPPAWAEKLIIEKILTYPEHKKEAHRKACLLYLSGQVLPCPIIKEENTITGVPSCYSLLSEHPAQCWYVRLAVNLQLFGSPLKSLKRCLQWPVKVPSKGARVVARRFKYLLH